MKTALLTALAFGFAVASAGFALAQSREPRGEASPPGSVSDKGAAVRQDGNNGITGRSVYEGDNERDRYQLYVVPRDATMHGGGH